jgi:hypothetical protein
MATNGIMWRDEQPLTDSAARLAISAMGNVANGFQALGANINTGLDREIARRDLIDAKNKAANTQFLINTLNQADNLEDKRALVQAGFGNIANLRGQLGEFDERAINSELALLDQGINNRFLSQDSLKLSTPEGRQALLDLNTAIAENNPKAIRSAMQNENLPLSLLGSAANAASQTARFNTAEDHYNQEQAFKLKEYENNQQSIRIKEQQKLNDDLARIIANHGTAEAAMVTRSLAVMQKYNYNSFNEIQAGLNSSNQAERDRATNAFNEMGKEWETVGQKQQWQKIFNLGAKDFREMGIQLLQNRFAFNPEANNPAGSEQPTQTTNPNLTGSNYVNPTTGQPRLIYTPEVRQAISQAQQSQGTVPSSTSSVRQALVGQNTDPIGGLVQRTSTTNSPMQKQASDENLAGMLTAAGLDSKTLQSIGINPNMVNSKSGSYTSGVQTYQSLSPQQQANIQQKAHMLGNIENVVMEELDRRINPTIGDGISLPMRQIMNPKLSDAEKNTAKQMTKYALGKDEDTALAYIRNSLFPNENKGIDSVLPASTEWAFYDKAAASIIQAIRKNPDNPHIADMAIGLVKAMKPKDGGTYARWFSDTPEAGSLIASLETLSTMSKTKYDEIGVQIRQAQTASKLSPIDRAALITNPNVTPENMTEAIMNINPDWNRMIRHSQAQRQKPQGRTNREKQQEQKRHPVFRGNPTFGIYG